MYNLKLSTAQTISFVMINSVGVEIAGLTGAGLTVQISKAGGAFAPSTGAKTEISDGWYTYTLSAAETNTEGPLAVMVDGAGCVQQNLLFQVVDFAITAIEFTYTVTNSVTGLPIEGVQCFFCTDAAGTNVVWSGDTDTFGVARDDAGNLPRLDPGTYYIFRQKSGYTFIDPDTETVSNP